MTVDAHVYCLPPRLTDSNVRLPESENKILDAIYSHPESALALKLASVREIRKSMKKYFIDRVVLVSLPWTSHELCCENNDYLLEIAAAQKSFWVVCAVQPKDNSWLAESERCINNGAIGLKINPDWQGYELDGKEMDELAEFIKVKNRFLMVHIDHIFKESSASPAKLCQLVKRHPETRILASHLGGMLGLYNLYPPIKNLLRNVWFDTAVSSTIKMVSFYMEAGLQDKIIFGSDFPFNHCHSQGEVVKDIKALNLKTEVENLIFSDNFFMLAGQNCDECL